MSYLQWLVIFFGIPLLVFFVIDAKIFLKYQHIFFKTIVGVLFVGLPADLIAVNLKLWSFPRGLLGLSVLTIPVEEYLWAGMYAVIVVFLTLYFLKKEAVS